MSRLPGSSDPVSDHPVPADLSVRRLGRWTCGAELPQGRATAAIDLMKHTGPGNTWRLVVDADGFAQLQVIEHHGRSRQGCWAKVGRDEIAALQSHFREAGLCERPDEPRAADGGPWFDISVELPATSMSCVRHLPEASLRHSAGGRRLVDDLHGWLDRVTGGSFRKIELFATNGPDHTPPAPAVRKGRLRCGLDRETIYAPGDTWLLDYSFQRGLLWRRGLEVSRDGAVAIDLASFQNGARHSCTGHLTARELGDLDEALAETRPCQVKAAPSSADEDHAYLSVHRAGMDCRYRSLRRQDLLDSRDGRRFDEVVTSLVRSLLGPGGADPFDPRDGLLFEPRAARTGERIAAGGSWRTRGSFAATTR